MSETFTILTECSTPMGSIAKAMAEAQKRIVGVTKDSTNPHFKADYASLAAVWDASHEALNDNQIAILQAPSIVDGKQVLVTILAHSSGEWFRGVCKVEPTQNTPQGMGSAFTYARRQSLAAMTGVAPKDDDGNEASERPLAIPREQKRSQQRAPETEPQQTTPAVETLPETIPDDIAEFPAAILARNKPLRQFEGVPLKLLVANDLDLCLETLKRSYDVRSKDGKTPEHALAWMRALVATLVALRAKAGTVEALDKFAEKTGAP